MATKTNETKKVLLTLYFTEKEAQFIVNKLKSIHRRYDFTYEKADNSYWIYCLDSTGDEMDIIKELFIYLLDRMVYGLD